MSSVLSKIWIPILLALVTIGGIFAWQYFEKQIVQTNTSEVTKYETATWQTYRNEEFGFEIQFPQTNMATKEFHLNQIDFIAQEIDGGEIIIGPFGPYPLGYEDPAIEFRREKVVFGGLPANKTTVLLEGNIIDIHINRFEKIGHPEWDYDAEILVFVHDDKKIDIIDQILSTFRFLEK